MKHFITRALLFLPLALMPATPALATDGPAPLQALRDSVTYRNYFGNMTFSRPLLFAQYPGQDSVYMVMEQVGRLTTVAWNGTAWTKAQTATIQVPVVTGTGGNKCSVHQPRATSSGITNGTYESRGLLGFAFHPNYTENRKYYVSYITVQDSALAGGGVTTHERSIIAERIADSATMRPATSDPERILINFCQPGWDHKGGGIGFGHDGYLYYTSGDGGNQELGNSVNNPSLNGASWLGKVIRINVDSMEVGREYAIPADNPFVDSSGFLPEVWAWGLRNPWKWHFHPTTGEMWLGNVGWVTRDDILRVNKGSYFGWPIWEGDQCGNQVNRGNNATFQALCATTPITMPALSLVHNEDVRSVTGGTFFVGDTNAALHDVYFFGDYIYNYVWMARFSDSGLVDQAQLPNINNVVSFDRDSLGRMFAVSMGGNNSGQVLIIESPYFEKAYVPAAVDTTDPEEPPIGIRGIQGRGGAAFTAADYLRDPSRFTVHGLDGRMLRGPATGTVWIREKGSNEPPRLITIMR